MFSGFSISRIKNKDIQASMTLEAAVALPLFLFFFLNLLYIIEIYRLQGTLLYSLREVGQTLSVYAYAYDRIMDPEDDSGIEAFIEDAAFSYLYVKGRVEKLAGEAYLDGSPLMEGKKGILYLDSSIMQEGDRIDLVLSYRISPLIELVGFGSAWFHSRYYGRAWTGYQVDGEAGEEESYVYVAEHASVYHTDRDCTHLGLAVRECRSWEIAGMRNEYGSRYTACEKCSVTECSVYYVATFGERYHGSADCSGLKRTVHRMKRAEAERRYEKCSRCG